MKVIRQRILIILLTSALIFLLDQILKSLIVKQILPIQYSFNSGAGFSLFQNSAGFLAAVGVILILIMIFLFDKIASREKFVQIAAGLILGGIAGNTLDRIRLGYVIDFISLKAGSSFNIADCAITVGVFILVVYLAKKLFARSSSVN